MTSNELRSKFLQYFADRGHEVVASSSLVPGNDPTLLFTNAGMVQFKDVFLGQDQRNYTKATSSQTCVRAGGKHNDLENVGYTARHHTFFEMLGNFSFGDYFKREAINFAWDFLTKELGLSPAKLWVTVFEEDQEAEDIWLQEVKVDPKRFSRCGAKDNFWSMGDTGPCGPCTEIFYDHGSSIPGGPPGSADEDGDRYVEVWNLVFMQYDRDSNGQMKPLPKPSVDTGMGLERIAAVMQGVHNNYDIDIFRELIKSTTALLNIKDENQSSLRVIADHIRSTSFLIADGVTPSNEGRGYVLRRIIRRAIRHGNKLGAHDAFFHKLVAPLVTIMGQAFTNLAKSQKRIESVLAREEEQFARTLDSGMQVLEQALETISGTEIPGEVVFKLYDTFGFPTDLTADIARERNLTIDYAGFEKEMAKQKQQSQAASRFAVDVTKALQVQGETEFSGYDHTVDTGVIAAIFDESGEALASLAKGQEGIVVLDRTPFYAESGGQVGDSGVLITETARFVVGDTKKQGMVHLHCGKVKDGDIKVGDKVEAEVSSEREAIMLNHTATHLLHAALRRVLGNEVIQKGSLVEAERLRFDFSYPQAMTREQITTVESLVNQQIRANLSAKVTVMSPDEAIEKGALALFGEKYGNNVRVLNIGEFSMELCGGTHVEHTAEIGLLKITKEEGTAAGIRRIEAVTGEKAFEWVSQSDDLIFELGQLLKSNRQDVLPKLNQLLKNKRELEKEISDLKQKISSQTSSDLSGVARDVGGIQVIATQVEVADVDSLRNMVDQLKQKLDKAVVVLAGIEDQKIRLIAGVTKNCTDKFKAGDLVKHVAEQVGGKGGGRPDMAQGGGEDVSALLPALNSVEQWVREKL